MGVPDSITAAGWHRLTATDASTAGQWRAEARVDGGSPWFDGHFPGVPVLPGIAQLAMVRDVLAGAMRTPVTVAGMRRVRFKRRILPGEPLTVTASPPTAGGAVAFCLLAGEEVACTGTLFITPGAGGGGPNGPQRDPAPL